MLQVNLGLKMYKTIHIDFEIHSRLDLIELLHY